MIGRIKALLRRPGGALGLTLSVNIDPGPLREGLEHAYRAFLLVPGSGPADLQMTFRRTRLGAQLDRKTDEGRE